MSSKTTMILEVILNICVSLFFAVVTIAVSVGLVQELKSWKRKKQIKAA